MHKLIAYNAPLVNTPHKPFPTWLYCTSYRVNSGADKMRSPREVELGQGRAWTG